MRRKELSKGTQFYTLTLWSFDQAFLVPLVSQTLVSVCQSSYCSIVKLQLLYSLSVVISSPFLCWFIYRTVGPTGWYTGRTEKACISQVTALRSYLLFVNPIVCVHPCITQLQATLDKYHTIVSGIMIEFPSLAVVVAYPLSQ